MGPTDADAPHRPSPQPAALRERFGPALEACAGSARAGEVFAGWLRAERSDFVRFNRGRVRQAGTVERATLEMRLIAEGRQARHRLTLTGEAGADRALVAGAAGALRAAIAAAPPDPFLSFVAGASRSAHLHAMASPSTGEIADTVGAAAAGADLVGFYAAGPVACAMASSLGHGHWHETASWAFDYSIHGVSPARDRALKAFAGGNDWSAAALAGSVARSVRDAAVLARPARRLPPAHYRTYLAPRALAELVDVLGWGGYSARALATGQSPLAMLREGSAAFDPRVSLAEDLLGAGAPRFQADGFVRPDRLDLVRDGRYAGSLVSPRTAVEFALEGNGAGPAEAPEALSMRGGDLDEDRALQALGTGLAVSNLWYLNFSDRAHCRVTGMTRFATVWVEDGEPVAPVEPMRFDDSLYRVLGESLEALTRDPRRFPDTSTYEARSFGSTTVPGALVRDLRFTL